MRTTYNKTSNIIDLTEFRRRQVLAQRDSLARQPEEEIWVPEERRRARRERRAWCLDICASLAVILVTAVFALRVLI